MYLFTYFRYRDTILSNLAKCSRESIDCGFIFDLFSRKTGSKGPDEENDKSTNYEEKTGGDITHTYHLDSFNEVTAGSDMDHPSTYVDIDMKNKELNDLKVNKPTVSEMPPQLSYQSEDKISTNSPNSPIYSKDLTDCFEPGYMNSMQDLTADPYAIVDIKS